MPVAHLSVKNCAFEFIASSRMRRRYITSTTSLVLLLLLFSKLSFSVEIESSSKKVRLQSTQSNFLPPNSDLDVPARKAGIADSISKKLHLQREKVYLEDTSHASVNDDALPAATNYVKNHKSPIIGRRKIIDLQIADPHSTAEEASKAIADTLIGFRHSYVKSSSSVTTAEHKKERTELDSYIHANTKDEESVKARYSNFNKLHQQESRLKSKKRGIEEEDLKSWKKKTQRLQLENTVEEEMYPRITAIEPGDTFLNVFVETTKGQHSKNAPSSCKRDTCIYKCTARPGNHTAKSEFLPVKISPLLNGVTYTVGCSVTVASGKESVMSIKKMGMPFGKPGAPIIHDLEVNYFHGKDPNSTKMEPYPQEFASSSNFSSYALYLSLKPADPIFRYPLLQRSDGGSPITSCKATAKDKKSGEIYTSDSVATTYEQLTIRGVKPRHAYSVHAICSNKFLPSDPSLQVSLIVPTQIETRSKNKHDCHVDKRLIASGQAFRLPGLNEARYLSRVIYNSCDLRDLLRPGDYVKCNGIEAVVQGPQDVQRFTMKDKWCDEDTMDLECYKMGKDYNPKANDWIPLIGKYAVMKNSTCVTSEVTYLSPEIGSSKTFHVPNEGIHDTECIKIGCKHYTVVSGGSPARPGTVLRPCPKEHNKLLDEKTIRSDRLVEEIEEGLEMTAENLPFGSPKRDKIATTHVAAKSPNKPSCARIPGYVLNIERPYEGNTDALLTAYRLKPFAVSPKKPIGQAHTTCSVILDKGSKKRGLLSCPCSVGEVTDIYLGTPFNEKDMNNLPCGTTTDTIKKIFEKFGKVAQVMLQSFGATGNGKCPRVTAGVLKKSKKFKVDLANLGCDKTSYSKMKIKKKCIAGTCYVLDYKTRRVTNLDFNPTLDYPSSKPLPVPMQNTPDYGPTKWPDWFKCYASSPQKKMTGKCIKAALDDTTCTKKKNVVRKMECKEKELIKKYPIQIMMVSRERHKKSLETSKPETSASTEAHKDLDKISKRNPDPDTQLKAGCVQEAVATYKIAWQNANAPKPQQLSTLMEAEMVETVQQVKQTAKEFAQQFLLDNAIATIEIASLAAVCSVRKSEEEKSRNHTIYDYYGPEGWAAPKSFGRESYKNKWGVKGGWYQNEDYEDDQKLKYFHTLSQNGGKMPEEGVGKQDLTLLIEKLAANFRAQSRQLRGRKTKVYIEQSRETPRLKCNNNPYAIIRMKNTDEAIKAVRSLNGVTSPELGGTTLDVHFASPTEKKMCGTKCFNADAVRRNMSKLYVFAINARSAYADMMRKQEELKFMHLHLGYGMNETYHKNLQDVASGVLRLKQEALRTWKAWYNVRKQNEALEVCPQKGCTKTFLPLRKCDKVKVGEDFNTIYTVTKSDLQSHIIEFDPPLSTETGPRLVKPVYFHKEGNIDENLIKLAEEKMTCQTMECILQIQEQELAIYYKEGNRDLHGGHHIVEVDEKSCKATKKKPEEDFSKLILDYIGSKKPSSTTFKCAANTKFINKFTLPKAGSFRKIKVNFGNRRNIIVGAIYDEGDNGKPETLISRTQIESTGLSGEWVSLKLNKSPLKLKPGDYFFSITVKNNGICNGRRSYSLKYQTTVESFNSAAKDFPTEVPLRPATFMIAMYADYTVDIDTEAKLQTERNELEADVEVENERNEKIRVLKGHDKVRFKTKSLGMDKLEPNEKLIPVTSRDPSWVPQYQKDDKYDPTWYPNNFAVPPIDGMPDLTKTFKVRHVVVRKERYGDMSTVAKQSKIRTLKRL